MSSHPIQADNTKYSARFDFDPAKIRENGENIPGVHKITPSKEIVTVHSKISPH